MQTGDKAFMKALPIRERCYDPKHGGGSTHFGYCWVKCNQCQESCNSAYWGAAGKRLSEMEQLVDAD